MMTHRERQIHLRQLHAETVRTSNACQGAYARGDEAEGRRLEQIANAAGKAYYDACEADPTAAPRTHED